MITHFLALAALLPGSDQYPVTSGQLASLDASAPTVPVRHSPLPDPASSPSPISLSSPSLPSSSDSPEEALVTDLSHATLWHGELYAPSGTRIARLRADRAWIALANLPGRVLAVCGGARDLAAVGSGFLWLQPRARDSEPVLFEEPGEWLAIAPQGDQWVAISADGDLVSFGPKGVQSRSNVGPATRLNSVTEAWNQWWLAGQRHNQPIVLTAATPAGPWNEASTGGKSPILRVAGYEHYLVAFGADGSAFRAIEGNPWEPSPSFEALGQEAPVNVFASDEEGFVALTPRGLVQSRDGLNWIRLAYQDDPYGSRALVHDASGTVLISQSWSAKGLSLRREPVTPYATFQLAQAYANGEGAPLDPKRAVELYRKAAGAGVRRAQVELAFLIASGQAPASSPSEASAWYLLLCGEEGQACAPEEAFKRIQALALRGRAEAQGIVAVLLRLGFGTKSDSIEATAWTLIAEEHEANLYALDWYADPSDDAFAAKARADDLRAQIARPASRTTAVSGTGD